MVYYAILNEENICTHISCQTELNNPPSNYIKLSGKVDVQWRKYENGEWSEEKYEPIPDTSEPEVTTEDKINYIYYKQMGVLS